MKANKPDAANPARALWLTIENQWRRVADLGDLVMRVEPTDSAEQSAPPNGGPAMRFGNSGADGGPPSVS